MPRFGSVITAMVTPVRPRRGARSGRRRRPGPPPGRLGQRGPGGGRHHRRGPGPHRRRADRPVPGRGRGRRRPGHRLDRHQRHRPLGDADQGGRSRPGPHARAGGHPVLQPAVAGRTVRPLPGRGRRHRPPGGPLRHPRAIGTPDRPRAHHRAGPRGSDHRGREGRHRRRGRAPPTVVAEAPAGFDVYCGDDSLTLPVRLDRRCRHHQRGRPLGRPAVRRDDRAATGPGTWSGPPTSTSAWSSPTGSSPPTSTRTRFRPRPPAGPSGSRRPVPAAQPAGARSTSTTRPAPSSRSWASSIPAHQSVA